MYYITHAAWQNGSGWSYEEPIDDTDEPLTPEELEEYYSEYMANSADEIRLYDEDGNLISVY